MNNFGRTFTQGEPVGKGGRTQQVADSVLSAGGGFSTGYFPAGIYISIGRTHDAVKNIWPSGNLLVSGLPVSFFSRGSSPLSEHNSKNITNIIPHMHSGTKFDISNNSKNHKSRNLPT